MTQKKPTHTKSPATTGSGDLFHRTPAPPAVAASAQPSAAAVAAPGSSPENALSPAALNRLARHAVEKHIGRVWISGEVTGFSRHAASGHCYFSLKDAQASVSCAWFRRQIRPGQSLQNGDKVLILGQVSIYEARGAYQVIVQRVEVGGQGDLHQQFVALKKRLEELGLFDAQFKKPLPAHPRRIAIITSHSGAAVQDVLKTIARRNPLLEVVLLHAAVQGESAPQELIAALEKADAGDFDAILLTRGGGSLEDLWAFNDEGLAHTLFTLQTPVISAVGHERDFTIADYVADRRAATPTAGAELLSPDLRATRVGLQKKAQRLQYLAERHTQQAAQATDQLSSRLFRADPRRAIAQLKHRLAQRQQRLYARGQMHLRQAAARLKTKEDALARSHPHRRLNSNKAQLAKQLNQLLAAVSGQLGQADESTRQRFHRLMQHTPRTREHHQSLKTNRQRLQQALQTHWQEAQTRFQHRLQLLDQLSPLRVLERGYSITQHLDSGKVITHSQQVSAGDKILTRLRQGALVSTVQSVRPDNGLPESLPSAGTHGHKPESA